MADIVWTEEALSDLEAIGDYFERTSPQYASSIVDRLYSLVEPLAEHPKMAAGFQKWATKPCAN